MSFRDEFAALLNSVKINSTENPETMSQKLSTIASFIRKNIPHHLYRYRSVSTYSISALENDEYGEVIFYN